MKKYIRTPDDEMRSGQISIAELHPDDHKDQLSSWLFVGPDEIHGKFSLGNMVSKRLEISVDTYTPDGYTEEHTHPDKEQAYYIVSGRAKATVGVEEGEVGPGGVVYIPLNMPHGFANAGDEPLTVVVISSYEL